jgi:hypothetical protein
MASSYKAQYEALAAEVLREHSPMWVVNYPLSCNLDKCVHQGNCVETLMTVCRTCVDFVQFPGNEGLDGVNRAWPCAVASLAGAR